MKVKQSSGYGFVEIKVGDLVKKIKGFGAGQIAIVLSFGCNEKCGEFVECKFSDDVDKIAPVHLCLATEVDRQDRIRELLTEVQFLQTLIRDNQ